MMQALLVIVYMMSLKFGTSLGGTTPNNDAQVTITSVDSNGFPTGASRNR